MKMLKYTLLSDGSSDQALLPILSWVLHAQSNELEVQSEWADLRLLPTPPQTLVTKIARGIELYPCNILFIHRDAESQSPQLRVDEIQRAIDEAAQAQTLPTHVCVVPVRMQEAWLLFDEMAIRYAAGNPNGNVPITLPPLDHLEELPSPKAELYQLLRQASGRTGRRLKRFQPNKQVRRIPDFIDDFSPLRALSAFATLETDVARIIIQS